MYSLRGQSWGYFTSTYHIVSLPGTNVQAVNLEAGEGKVHNAFLHDVESHLGTGRDLGEEGECGGDGHGGPGLDLHGEWLHINSID